MKRLVPFLAAALLLSVPSVASAHTAAADLSCAVPRPVLTVDLTRYDGAHVVIAVDHVVVVDQDFASQFHTTRNVGSPSEGHTATVTVTASDSTEYDRTFDLSSPPCVVHQKVRPYGFIDGPCGDPLYRFGLDNGQSTVPVTFRVSYTAYSSHAVRVFHVTLAAHQTVTSKLHHVLGGTRMTIRAVGRVLASKVSAPAGYYGKCSLMIRE